MSTIYTLSNAAITALESIIIGSYRERDAEYQEEAVWLIYGYTSDQGIVIEKFMDCPNAHEDPLFYFGVDKREAESITSGVQLDRPELDLVGCLHTHEDKGNKGPSWPDVNSARAGTINAVVCVYDRSVSFYDDHGFIIKFKLHKGTLKTIAKEAVASDTHITQYPFPPSDQ